MPGRQDELLAGLEQFSSNPPPPCSHINQVKIRLTVNNFTGNPIYN